MIPRALHAVLNAREMNTAPWSNTIVSGMITGLAAAPASRSSRASIRRYGKALSAIDSALLQPGRIGSGARALANSRLASTALVDGRSTAASTERVALSLIAVSSTFPLTPAPRSTSTSSGVESICTTSPGEIASRRENGPSGRLAIDRRVVAEPVVWRPQESAARS